ncbi:uncharacterized protein LOC118752165, partial [Rhagoletis pomonella]|uniref:uncharacterized protein LOC118752165 n=1 Tax=Rhagoletis pomonella TaxID=28610 RepID=UPI001783F819
MAEVIAASSIHLTIFSDFIIFDRFSSYLKLKRTTAWIFRFTNRARRRLYANENFGLNSCELDSAEKLLCRQAQAAFYASEIHSLREKQMLPNDSTIRDLLPFLDGDEVMRVGGRIEAASHLPFEAIHPIILPTRHRVTALIVAYYHQRMKHQNTEATIGEIRQKFWVTKLRQVLRGVIANCQVCKLARSKPVTPIMAPLPADRLTPFVRPFTYTGLDYFGPLKVTKRWIALFTCLTVRAIHLEVAHDLSTDSCILTIRNFINRRGTPVRIRSDNGKNFVGADQIAKRFDDVFDCERVQSELANKGVEWMFNCPNNPSEGGIWERMVRCVKRALYHMLKETAPREQTLQSAIIEAENIGNSRHLTHIAMSADQEEPLTPNHFLLGTSNTAKTPTLSEVEEKTYTLRKQWRIARHLRQRVWKRWILE